MDNKSLEVYFIETQMEYLDEYSDRELLDDLEDAMSDEDFQELVDAV